DDEYPPGPGGGISLTPRSELKKMRKEFAKLTGRVKSLEQTKADKKEVEALAHTKASKVALAAGLSYVAQATKDGIAAFAQVTKDDVAAIDGKVDIVNERVTTVAMAIRAEVAAVD